MRLIRSLFNRLDDIIYKYVHLKIYKDLKKDKSSPEGLAQK